MVVYQIYPRSFQDSTGDGDGDLAGITSRLDHLAWLGVDALWLSPIFPSPMADGGYDVAAYTDVDPRFGSLGDLDALVARARELGLKVLLDLVPSHTSIEHPWFTAHPERYVFSPVDGPANNWRSAFGGSAWAQDPHGRGWYLHSFYPEQPDLDWHNPDVPAAFAEIFAFWRARGIDGFRVDALQQLVKDAELRDDPPASGPPRFPQEPGFDALEHRHSSNAQGSAQAMAALRAGAGPQLLLVGEVFVAPERLGPYVEQLDAAFCFELFFAAWEAEPIAAAIQAGIDAGKPAWVLSNHDFPRLPSRVGEANVRGAALLLLALPGLAFLYYGDELAQLDGPAGERVHDRFGRDAYRRPMQWDASAGGGFTAPGSEPWLEPVDPAARNVEVQRADAASTLCFYRELIALRRELRGPVSELRAQDGVVSWRRGEHRVIVNVSGAAAKRPSGPQVLLATHPDVPDLPRGAGILLRDRA